MNFLKKDIDSAKRLNIGNYSFKLFSFGERGQQLKYQLLNEINKKLSCSIKENFGDFDYIISPEPGGHLWGILVAINLKKDLKILRLMASNKPSEKNFLRSTIYNSNQLFFSGIKKGDKVLIIDDVISSGLTIEGIIKKLSDIGVEIIGVQIIVAKSNNYKKITKNFGVKIVPLESKFD